MFMGVKVHEVSWCSVIYILYCALNAKLPVTAFSVQVSLCVLECLYEVRLRNDYTLVNAEKGGGLVSFSGWFLCLSVCLHVKFTDSCKK